MLMAKYPMACELAGPTVRFNNRFQRTSILTGMRVERFADQTGNVRKRDSSFQECGDRNFIRSIEHRWSGSPGVDGVIRQGDARKLFAIGWTEVESRYRH